MDTAVISFDLDTTNPESALGFEFWVDDVLVSDINHVASPSTIEYRLKDDDAQHQLKLVLKNKTWAHTQIDDAGNIIQDSCISIKNLKFDGIELGHMFVELAQYHHQNNDPTQPKTIDPFYGEMGCNGYVVLNFSTPIYLWLLENM